MDKTRFFLLVVLVFFGKVADGQQLISFEAKGGENKQVLQEKYSPLIQNAVKRYKITYTTTGIDGKPDTASGLLLVPDRTGAQLPLLAYQHGTVVSKQDVPSNLQGGYEVAEVFAGVGYVTAAPDFLGLGDSRGFHPYVHAASEAWVAVDMLLAVKEFCAQQNITLNDQLFLSGYSQGGHASMALHRALESGMGSGFTVTAAAHMSGPYSISGEMKKLMTGDEEYGSVAYLPFTALSYKEVYGIFGNTGDFFLQPYATPIQQFYEGRITLSMLDELLTKQLKELTGKSVPKRMLQDSIVDILLGRPDHPISQALADNDVYRWKPLAPTRLFYCKADDQVPYLNSLVAQDSMNARGAADLKAVDVGISLDHGQCVRPALTNAILFFATYQKISTPVVDLVNRINRSLFPNPTYGKVYLSSPVAQGTYSVYNNNGKLLRTGEIKENNLDLSGLNPGFYIVQIRAGAASFQEKMVVVR